MLLSRKRLFFILCVVCFCTTVGVFMGWTKLRLAPALDRNDNANHPTQQNNTETTPPAIKTSTQGQGKTDEVMNKENIEQPTGRKISTDSGLYNNTRELDEIQDNKSDEEVWNDINNSRKKRIQEYCDKDNSPRSKTLTQGHYFLYNDKWKIIYCYIPKIACTQWKKVFLTLQGIKSIETLSHYETHTGFRVNMKRLKDLPYDQIQAKLRTYKKFMFVREPYERLVSAYRDKFMHKNNWFKSMYGKSIIRKYRMGATNEEINRGDDVKFSEFLKFIADRNFDEHWQLQSKLCQPCVVDFDYIGHFETLEDDANWILKKTGLSEQIKFPPVKTSNTATHLKESYSNISKDILRKIADVYSSDMKYFGYENPEEIKVLLDI